MLHALLVTPPILTPFYHIVFVTLVIEMILLILLGLIGIGIQWYLIKRRKKQKRVQQELVSKFSQQLSNKTPFSPHAFTKKELDLSNLLPVLSNFKNETKEWRELKEGLSQSFLLPKARKFAHFPHWIYKLKAIRCFALAPNVEDEKSVLHLLKHKRPIIKIVAAHVAAQIGTDRAISAILDEMNQSSHYLRIPFRNALSKSSERVLSYLEKRLHHEKDPYIRVSCIEVLTDHMDEQVVKAIENDLASEHKNLKISAIRALGHYKSAHSIHLLIPLLKDRDWEVQAVTARSLGYLKANQAIEKLSELCSHEVWLVRMNAALALKRMGPSGIRILKTMNQKEDPFAFETAHYVLSIED